MFKLKRLLVLTGIFFLSAFQSLTGDQIAGQHEIILVTPNLDDDNLDGKPDSNDMTINGFRDYHDLTPVEIPIPIERCIPRIIGPGKAYYRILKQEKIAGRRTRLYLEATTTRSSDSAATLEISSPSKDIPDFSLPLDIKPFLLTSSVNPPSEVFIVKVPRSESAVVELQQVFSKIPGAPTLTVISVPDGSERDVWVQDATEIGHFRDTSISAALAGLRGKHSFVELRAELLDRHLADLFLRQDQCVLVVGESLANRRWIDWFGNLESTPAHIGPDGSQFPFGRVLVGQQDELSMHNDVMEFIKNQRVQWPPIVLDTSMCHIGHVDEIVNFFPVKDGFKTILPSPALGKKLLEQLADNGHGDKVLFVGKHSPHTGMKETSVNRILANTKLMEANKKATEIINANREILMQEMNLTSEDIIELPLVFNPKGPLWPNPVNGLVINKHYIAPKPFGPLIKGVDVIEEAYRAAFKGCEACLYFLDFFEGYSRYAGDVHCGTNAIRYR